MIKSQPAHYNKKFVFCVWCSCDRGIMWSFPGAWIGGL